jgi:hypothetical protein
MFPNKQVDYLRFNYFFTLLIFLRILVVMKL